MSKLAEVTKRAEKLAAKKPRKGAKKKVTDRARSGISSAKKKASDGGAAAKRKAGEIYGKGRDVAAKGAKRSGESIDANPIAAVVGGLALGAIVGALVPRSDREEKLMGKTGKKLNDGARNAASAAKEAGKKRMGEVGLDAGNAKDQFREFFGKATDAAKAAGDAAKDSVTKGE